MHPASTEQTNPTAAMRRAPWRSPAPSIRARVLPEPWPKKNPVAWITAMTGKATPTAATLAVSSRPTNQASATL